ncbi:unnamed protein product, partial [Prorocentrum cordatum]
RFWLKPFWLELKPPRCKRCPRQQPSLCSCSAWRPMRGVGQALARSTAWPAMLAMLCGLPFVLFGPLRASKVLGSGRVMQPRPGSASGPTARGARKGTVPDPQECSHNREAALREYRMHGGRLFFT